MQSLARIWLPQNRIRRSYLEELLARPTSRLRADGKSVYGEGDTCRDGMDLMPVAALGAMEIALRTDGAELHPPVLAGVGVFCFPNFCFDPKNGS